MSAFIVSDRQYSIIACSIIHYLGLSESVALDYANTLKRENIRSVNYRYNERTKFKKVDYQSNKRESIHQVILFLKCIDYQSCECNNYYSSKAYKLNIELQNNLYGLLVKTDNYLWSIE